jgi:hypothetical protein
MAAINTRTQTIQNAVTKKSRFLFANQSSARLVVASITTTTIVFVDASQITGKTLYGASTPGLAVVGRGADDTFIGTDAGLTANITGFSSNTATVDVNFVTAGSAPALTAGDAVLVFPPMAFRPKLSGGHTFNANSANLMDKGLTDTFDNHNTPGTRDPSGDFTAFLCSDTNGAVRMLAALAGSYKKSGTGVHQMQPIEANDGTFTDSSELSVFVSDGNGVSDEAYGALFVQSGTINFPEAGIPTIQTSSAGAAVVREVGGTGKEFPAGGTNWDRAAVNGDNDPLFTFTDVYMEVGGVFGDAMTTAVDQAITSASISITKGSAAPRPLGGHGYTTKPTEVEHTVTLTLTRTYEDDTFRARYFGNGAMPAKKIESRFLFQAFDPATIARYIKIDFPRAICETSEPQRNAQGLVVEQITVRALQTLTAAKATDTTKPLYRIEVANGVDSDILTTLV